MEKTLARMNGVLNMENFMSRYSLSLSLSVSLLFGQGLALASTGKPVQKDASNNKGDSILLAQAKSGSVVASPIPPIVSGSL